MEERDRRALKEVLGEFLNERLERLILSSPAEKNGLQKVKIHPLLLRGELAFQAEEQRGAQAFHRNMDRDGAAAYVIEMLNGIMRQMELSSASGSVHALVSKKGKVTVKTKRKIAAAVPAAPALRPHNRKKRYVLEEGRPVPFLVDLGVMTKEGQVVRSRYDKFRQINRFLEFIEDILPKLDRSRENVIIDFGCGKSYLTFAMYYYLKELKGYPVRIIGLDLKKDVIARCNLLAERYGFDHLRFYPGDIASYEGVDQVDMVVTLHACDTATDYALYKAVKWGAKVILSVPCCQHELNGQMENEILAPLFSYGIIRERTAALFTDAIRAEILEGQGYRTQLLEFIDMEHTPKNILIRAVRQGEKKKNGEELKSVLQFLHGDLTLYRLFEEDGREKA
ncbi:MAG TPA: SAM-dependent methyltransferase [Candidatus Lachnoclostridium pullistercoris]|uniref:SAM-dependent methyltransferase n=1 Tax=Candidatus Lachnoclostridium pullistercoris TaxID=2838632 RepID=A0A9D2PFZ3_9FIRM|nr:SAM-dependent methyltransferase [Candidatus Lachnoclostridium pullistercoris]